MQAPYHSRVRFPMALLAASVLTHPAKAATAPHAIAAIAARHVSCEAPGLRPQDLRTPEAACLMWLDPHRHALCHVLDIQTDGTIDWECTLVEGGNRQ